MKLFCKDKKGIALVVTLLVIVVLTIAVTAFMQSMSLERRTSRAYLNIFQAENASQAALEELKTRILTLKQGPRAAIYIPASTTDTTPYLYLAKSQPTPSAAPTSMKIEGIPLFSSIQTSPAVIEPGTTRPLGTSINIDDLDRSGNKVTRTVANAASLTLDLNQSGAVGLRDTSGNLLKIPSNWIYLHDAKGKVSARYAYWTEDEASKLDLRTSGNTNGVAKIHLREQGDTFSDISLLSLEKITSSFSSTTETDLFRFRQTPMALYGMSLSNFRYLKDAANNPAYISDEIWNKIYPYVTINSDHDDRAPDGTRKLDLNILAQLPNRLKAIQQMRTVIKSNLPTFGNRFYRYDNHTQTLTYTDGSPAQVVWSPAGSNAAQDMDRSDYITKLCANILDYIDTDSNPTVLIGRPPNEHPPAGNAERVLNGKPTPDFGGDLTYISPDPKYMPVSIGKELGGFISEYVQVVRPITPSTNSESDDSAATQKPPVEVTFRLAHYVELRNYSSKTLSVAAGDFGQDPFIQIVNRSSWQPSSAFAKSPYIDPPQTRPIDVEIRLPANFTIPPRGFSVITTDKDPPAGQSSPPVQSPTVTYTIEKGAGAGTWSDVSDPGDKSPLTGNAGEDYTRLLFRTSSSGRKTWRYQQAGGSYATAEARIIFGNATTLLDMIPTLTSNITMNVPRDASATPGIAETRNFDNTNTNVSTRNQQIAFPNTNFGPRYNRGDLRANSDFKFLSATPDARRVTILQNATTPYANYSAVYLGKAKTEDTTSTSWDNSFPEYTTENRGNFFVANQTISSLGRLGDIFDPASVDKTYRSAFRTLRIGQSDDPTKNRAGNISTTANNDSIWTGGLGKDDYLSPLYAQNAFMLLDLFKTDSLTAGRINPNGLLRGSSPVIRALTDEFKFNSDSVTYSQTQGSAQLSGTSLQADPTTGVTNLETAIKTQLAAQKPFISNGDLSRLDIFSSSLTAEKDRLSRGSFNMFSVSDAGREEFFRRSANLLTINPLSFTVYIVGQAGEFTGTGDQFRVTATSKLAVLLNLRATYPTSLPEDIVSPDPALWNLSIKNLRQP